LGASEGAPPPPCLKLAPIRPSCPIADPPYVLDPALQAPLFAPRRAPTASPRQPSCRASTQPPPTPSPASPSPPAAAFFMCAPLAIFHIGTCACTRARPLARPAAAATDASLPSPLTHDAHGSPRPVCRPGAGVGVVMPPPQHAELAARWPAVEASHWPERASTAAACARRRPARAAPAVAGWVACAARARHLRRPAGPPAGCLAPIGWEAVLGRSPQRARSRSLRASNGPEAAPGGLGLAWRWAMVAPGPAAPPGTRLWRRSRRPHALMCVHAIFRNFRDCARLYVW
jgi:hypothetical protein